jgi:hypothetical protein
MRLFERSDRTGATWRRTVAAVATVIGLATAGGVVATGTANADPWNPTVNVVGRASVCGDHSFAVGIRYWGSNGDRGWVPVGRDGRFLIPLHHVGWRGEDVKGRVDCAWRPSKGFGFDIDRPWRGLFVHHDIH